MAIRLSLEYGGGDVRWFENLPRRDKVAVLAYERAQNEARADAARKARQ